MHLKTELEQRGFLHQYTHEELFDLYDAGGQRFYLGVDLSADSMTIGNFCALMQAFHIMRRGNKAYLLVGGATSTIGNPSGKDAERPMLTPEQLKVNQKGIHKQFQYLTKRAQAITGEKMNFTIVNNYDFFKDMNVLDFLREVGKYMTVNRMMSKDIVRRRVTDPDKFISFAEFAYMLIMGYDFFRLYIDEDVKLQIGGSDERDGILSGIELIHKKAGQTAYGLTNKLILDATGKKFGKSEGNAIWLDPDKNSPYIVYQYFLNTADADVPRFLKLLTFYDFDTIDEIVATHTQDTAARYGQKKLAEYIMQLIFDEHALAQAQAITAILFGEVDIEEIAAELQYRDFQALQQATGGVEVEPGEYKVTELVVQSGLCASNAEAKKTIKAGGISINQQIVSDIQQTVTIQDAVQGQLLLLKKGKRTYRTVLFH